MENPSPEKKKTSLNTYIRLIKFAKPYRLKLMIGLLCGVLFSGSTIGLLPKLKDVFGQFTGEAQVISMHMVWILILLMRKMRG